MRIKASIFGVLILFYFFTSSIYAHPGRTASDGCHYCRTNCDKWGEVWNARHCHGGYSKPEENSPIFVEPTKVPIFSPTLKPTIRSTPTPHITSTAIPFATTASFTEALGTSGQTNQPEAESVFAGTSNSNFSIGEYITLGVIGWGLYLFFKRKKKDLS